jgi:hypothetical protein
MVKIAAAETSANDFSELEIQTAEVKNCTE